MLHLTYPEGSFANGESISANNSGTTAVVQQITQPDLVPYSGQMIYSVTQAPIERDTAQTENFTITVKF